MSGTSLLVKYFLVAIVIVHLQPFTQAFNLLDLISPISESCLSSYNGTASEQCLNHTGLYISNLSSGSYWALQMFDSSTKIPESLLSGLTIQLGNFDECLGIEEVQTDQGPFSGKYCLATLAVPTDSESPVNRMLRSKQADIDRLQSIRNHPEVRMGTAMSSVLSGLTIAQCIPSTCKGEEYQDIINTCLKDLQLAMLFTEDDCQATKERDMATEDWVTVGIMIFIAVLAVLSTAYDLLKKENKNEMLTAFSWYSNGRKLLATSSSGDTLEAVHGIRFISMTWVVMGHRYELPGSLPTINQRAMLDIILDFWRLYLTNAPLSVDTFFFLSGLLVSYVFLKQMSRPKASFNVPVYYIHRYIRLTPPFAMMILMQATVLRYVSSGPMFKLSSDNLAETCQKYWWTDILYINNYFEIDKMCLGQSWYLSVDMQLFILSPIVLYPLWKWPKKWSLSWLGGLIVAGLVTAFTVSFVDENAANVLSVNAAESMKLQYYPTHTRFTPWLIGVLFGYVIYQTKKQQFKLSKMMVFIGWIIGAGALLSALLGLYPFIHYSELNIEASPEDYPGNFENSIYTALSRPAWALGVGWLTFACVCGYGGPINTFLSWKAFQPLSRLTYCVYLVHLSYQITRYMSVRTPGFIAEIFIAPDFFSDIVSCLMLATVLSLCTEAPIIVLEKRLLGGTKKNTSKAQANSNDQINNPGTSGNEVAVQIPNGEISEEVNNEEITKPQEINNNNEIA